MLAKVGEFLLYVVFGPLYFFFRIFRLTAQMVVPKWRHRASEFEQKELFELLEGRTILSLFVLWFMVALAVATVQGMHLPILLVPVVAFHLVISLLVYATVRRKRAELVRRGEVDATVRTGTVS